MKKSTSRKTSLRKQTSERESELGIRNAKHRTPQAAKTPRTYLTLSVLPLLAVMCIVPLTVFLKVTPVPSQYQQYWMTPQVFDFFSFYKAQIVLLCATILLTLLPIGIANRWISKKKLNIWLPTAIYALMIVIAAVVSEHPLISLNGFFERYEGMWLLMAYLVLMISTHLIISNVQQTRLLLNSWFVTLFIVCCIAVFQWFGLDPFRTLPGKLLILPSQYTNIASELEFNFPLGIIYSTLYNPNNVAVMLAMALPIAASLVFLESNRPSRLAILALVALLALVLLATKARGALIGAILSSAFILAVTKWGCKPLPRQRYIWASTIVTLGLGLVAAAPLVQTRVLEPQVWGYDNLGKQTATGQTDIADHIIRNYGKLGSGRVYIWTRSLQMAKETIFIGRGPDTFALYFPNTDPHKLNYYVKHEDFIDKPHNSFIQIWLNIGGIGFVAFMALIAIHLVSTTRILCRSFKRDDSYFLAAGLFAGWCSYLVSAFFYDSTVSVAPVFWIVFGLGLSANQSLLARQRRDNGADIDHLR